MKTLLPFLLEKTRQCLVFAIKTLVLPPKAESNSAPREDGVLKRRTRPLRAAYASFSPFQKKIFYVLAAASGVSIAGLFLALNSYFLVEVPLRGGMLTEGIIGTPRFINPLLAISDADRDLSALVYSGLMRATPDGELLPDLAEKYTVSEDGLTYTFTLKEDLVWHDGEPVSADDVVFTFTKVQDPLLKSPKRVNWEGVAVKKIDERTVALALMQPYSPFLENTAGFGILPRHIWEKVGTEQFGFANFNVSPIGSGPYKIADISSDSSGIPVYYDLVPFKRYSLGSPYIATIRIRFYANEEALLGALRNKEIGAVNAVTPSKAVEFADADDRTIETYRLPRVFGVFLNQNQKNMFAQKAVREALAVGIDREAIVASVLGGYGAALQGPLPPGALGFVEKEETADAPVGTSTTPAETAAAILEKAGWKPDEETGILRRKTKTTNDTLSFTLAVPDTDELRRAAELVKEQWAALGADITLRVFDAGDLQQNIIRPRRYDALFFGEIIGRESDPFAFWHSSQRNDPGLNIALYTNITVDDLLLRARKEEDRDKRAAIYGEFQNEIKKDTPAVFVYSPDFLYIHPWEVRGLTAGTITVPSERFLDVHRWFMKTDKVWRIFKQQKI